MSFKSIRSFFSLRKVATVRYQVIFIAIGGLFCLKLFHDKATKFTSTDPRPEFNVLTPDAVKKFLGSAIGHQVEAGMHIENFREFDMRKGIFSVDAIAWFRFNPSLLSLETVEKFSFEKGSIEKKSKPKTKLTNGLMLSRYDIQLKFTSNLDFRLFPFDDHRIYITLVNRTVSPGELVFDSQESQLSLSKNLSIAGWKQEGHDVETGYTEAILDRHETDLKVFQPIALFAIDFNRTGARQALILLLPMFVILYLSFVSLLLVFDYGVRLSLATGNIAAFLGYRFVIEGVAPKVGYSTVIDVIFNVFLFLAFLIFLINIAIEKREMRKLRGLILLLLHSTLLITVYYLVTYWMKV